ncbi:MAG: hypothetical protein L0241_01925 [Planctomycetia bacterium]|nr:hypothetical protein [Planctomycetia bacterium]
MPHRVRCRCRGNPDCKLCFGTKFYDYTPGPHGWMPFVCPTCEGKGTLPSANGNGPQECFTCRKAKTIDPANPPLNEDARGVLRTIWRIFFGG